ncbi:nucleotidyltransferase domain-containing protein [Streptomyces lunaelactis]|uniref:nucleotidyltransferase domain-containing protein n=1 Tax=Streptomyces lunaelactis TaxID=1535768 RepID=UPI001FE4232B|nr:nucleotidyltransferase domain-containing protein [Streptomyces lunaelactis]
MLHRLDRDSSWPLGLVQQVWLFGSFARGAAEPHDVDVAVRFERDEQMTQAVVQGPALRPCQPLRSAPPCPGGVVAGASVPVRGSGARAA